MMFIQDSEEARFTMIYVISSISLGSFEANVSSCFVSSSCDVSFFHHPATCLATVANIHIHLHGMEARHSLAMRHTHSVSTSRPHWLAASSIEPDGIFLTTMAANAWALHQRLGVWKLEPGFQQQIAHFLL